MKRTPTPPVYPRYSPTPDEIASRAYELWQRQGCPVGRDLENWLQAERELSQQGTYDDARDPLPNDPPSLGGSLPGREDAGIPVPFPESAPLADKVEKQLKPVSPRPQSRTSKTSLEL